MYTKNGSQFLKTKNRKQLPGHELQVHNIEGAVRERSPLEARNQKNLKINENQ